MGVCRENVDKVEGDPEFCTNQKLVLEDEPKDVKSKKKLVREECQVETTSGGGST